MCCSWELTRRSSCVIRPSPFPPPSAAPREKIFLPLEKAFGKPSTREKKGSYCGRAKGRRDSCAEIPQRQAKNNPIEGRRSKKPKQYCHPPCPPDLPRCPAKERRRGTKRDPIEKRPTWFFFAARPPSTHPHYTRGKCLRGCPLLLPAAQFLIMWNTLWNSSSFPVPVLHLLLS